MNPVKCPNCRLSLPQNWAGMNDPNAKCPYCGKPLSGQTAVPGSAPAARAAPVQPPPRPAGGAKTILWGVGAPIPGVVPKTVPQPPPPRPAPGAPVPTKDAFANAATQQRPPIANPVPAIPASSAAQPASPAAEAGEIDVDVEEADAPVPTGPAVEAASKANQPARTVMFEPSVAPVDTSLGKMERLAPEPETDTSEASEEALEPEPPTAPSPRATPSRAKAKPSSKKGYKPRPAAAGRWSTAEDDSDEPKPPSSKTPIIVVGAIAAVALISAGVYFLRGKGESPAQETDKAAEPAHAGPTPSVETPPLAAKPAPAEATNPPPAEKPAAKERPAAVEKSHAERQANAEKPAPPPSEPKLAGGKPSEEDYRRANEAYERGNAKLFQGDTAGAIADFNRALRLNPKDPAIQRGLGLSYAQSGKPAEGIKHLKLYLRAAPKAPDRALIEKRIDQLRGH